MMTDKKKSGILFIIGPTASGKTDFAIKLAGYLNGEIINADSMQVYKHMNIITNKPSEQQRQNIPHHLFDILEPAENFNVVDYKLLAETKIKDILSKNKLPIVVGGTGLYINALVYEMDFVNVTEDEKYRLELLDIAKNKGTDVLYDMLIKQDVKACEKIHKNDIFRVIRALEILKTGTLASSRDVRKFKINENRKSYILGINFLDRQKLYDKIHTRTQNMLDAGLIYEIKYLLNNGVGKTAIQAIGYKEFLNHLEGKATLAEAVETLNKNTRNYAKRQITWFNKLPNVHWLFVDNEHFFEQVNIDGIKAFLA